MDSLPFRRLHCRLRVFLLFLLFLLQNQDVRILPNHFLLWLHGRLQLGPRHALRDGERNIPKDEYLKISHNVIPQLLLHHFLSDWLSRDEHLCEENLCNRKDRLMISNQYFTECSKLVSTPHCNTHDDLMLWGQIGLIFHQSFNLYPIQWTFCFSSIETKYNPVELWDQGVD